MLKILKVEMPKVRTEQEHLCPAEKTAPETPSSSTICIIDANICGRSEANW